MVLARYMPVSHLTRAPMLRNRNVRAPRFLPPTQTLTTQPVVHMRSMKLGDFLPSTLQPPGNAVALLIMLILVASISAILTSFAIRPQTPTEDRAPSKLQYRLPAVAIDVESLVSHETYASPPEPDSISNRVALSQSEPVAQLDLVPTPSVLQSEPTVQANPDSRSAAHTESVPLPTRKPKKASTTVRRIARTHTRGESSRIVATKRDVSGERKE